MLSKEELRVKNTTFWNEFRKHMNKVRSADGRRMNWISYPSDVKHIYIRLQADANGARLCMDIQPKNEGVREILWEQMTELKKVLESTMQYETQWIEKWTSEEGKVISRIMWENPNLNFYKDEDKEAIFAFLKDRILSFDAFYYEFKEILISLMD